MSSKPANWFGIEAARAGAAHAGMAEAVVGRALVGVGDDRVGLGRRLELLFGRRVARVAIGMVLERQLAIGALDLGVGGVAPDAEDLVVVPLAHPLATFTIAGRSRRSPSMYPRLNSSTTSPSRRPSAGSCDTAMMEVRIEIRAERLDRLDAALAQRFEQLLVDQLDAAPDRLGRLAAGVGLERALHVVDERQQLLDAGPPPPLPTAGSARGRCACGSCRTRPSCAAADRSSRRAAASVRRDRSTRADRSGSLRPPRCGVVSSVSCSMGVSCYRRRD